MAPDGRRQAAREGTMSARNLSSSQPKRIVRALLLSAIVGAAVSAFPVASIGEEPVTGAQVRAAILRAVGALKKAQRPDGAWPDYAQEGGVTALCTYALLAADVSPDDKGMAGALEHLRTLKNQHTYVVALKALAFSAADPARYKADVQACVDWLVEMQHPTGAWGYGYPATGKTQPGAGAALSAARTEMELPRQYQRPDTSNTQFAMLALSEAEHAGAKVPADVWRKAERYFRATQLPGGGWGYVYHDPDPEEAYGSMTAAALASLYLCGDRLAKDAAEAAAERAAALERGIGWIADHYALRENPNRETAWYYFWLYGLERAGVASGRRTFGTHDWFREGADLLVGGQKPTGVWTDRLYHDALCLLFLVKGFRPLLAQRLEWQGEWRRDPSDLDHLVRFLGKRVGGEPVGWRTLASDSSLADYLAAPILHVTGRGPLHLLAAALPRFKQYVEQGGLVLFDAQGGDAAFTDSVRRLLEDEFPESKFEPLDAEHPLYRAVHRAAGADLEAMNIGCRAAVILAPKGLADGWAASDPDRATDALRLGENLAAYATGLAALPDRLAAAPIREMPQEEPPPRGATRIGQVQHDGDWRPRPYALPMFLKQMADRYGVSVYSRPVPVRLSDRALGTFNILYITGHYAFHLSDAERAALKAYLERGGFVWAEACCGRPAFDKALRELIKQMFPEAALKELPADHPIFSGKVGGRIESVTYSPAVKAESPDLKRPVLCALERGGHTVMIYSPYGISCGLDGIRTWGARAYSPEDAKRVATNIVLYALMP
jgi:hypothetical protein